jgi:alpha-L-fucosidase 2
VLEAAFFNVDEKATIRKRLGLTMTMKLVPPGLLVLALFLCGAAVRAEESETARKPDILSLWYDKPAEFQTARNGFGIPYRTLFNTAIPIGNGRLGALIKGGVAKEYLPLNEDTLWTGGLDPTGEILKMGVYQPLGNLIINLPGHEQYTDYRRSLDLRDGIAGVKYTANGVHYRREYFTSYPNHVIVTHLAADKPGSYTGSVTFEDAHSGITEAKGNRMTIIGCLENALHYETQIVVLNEGGSQTAHHDEYGDRIDFKDCDGVTIIAGAGTNYVMDYSKIQDNARYRGELPHEGLTQQMDNAEKLSYEQLKGADVADYQSLFNRFSIDLGASTDAQRALPTDVRKGRASKEMDPEFEQMFCQYGRYLVMASSRPGAVAANGNGIWSDSESMCYGGEYCDDIATTELIYWAVETTNLAECHLPLLDLIQSQLPAWRQDTWTSPDLKLANGEFARRGWAIRGSHNTMGGMAYWWNKPGNAWYCLHFWEHYAFGRDKEYLAKVAYPVIKETCEYWEDHLKALPDGRLVIPNMWSPEHGPWQDGVSHCQELVWDLFTNYMDASDALGIDKDYRDKIAALRDKLLAPGVGSWGQLLEWMTEQKDVPSTSEFDIAEDKRDGHIDTPENTHRHTSHLVGVYPCRQISFEQTPKLAAAALVSVKARGNGGGLEGWSYAARAPIYARLHQGDLAHDQIQRFLGCAMPNLISEALEFDGTPAMPEAFAEMLVQSQLGYISLLPALPKTWASGSVKGVRARGGFEVDESWADGKLTSATIRCVTGKSPTVRYGDKTAKLELRQGESVTLDGNLAVTK